MIEETVAQEFLSIQTKTQVITTGNKIEIVHTLDRPHKDTETLNKWLQENEEKKIQLAIQQVYNTNPPYGVDRIYTRIKDLLVKGIVIPEETAVVHTTIKIQEENAELSYIIRNSNDQLKGIVIPYFFRLRQELKKKGIRHITAYPADERLTPYWKHLGFKDSKYFPHIPRESTKMKVNQTYIETIGVEQLVKNTIQKNQENWNLFESGK